MRVSFPRLAAAALLGAVAVLPAGCAGHGDVYGRGHLTWTSYPIYGWYDNYYGAFYDGYWGIDGYFWFRLTPQERFRRDERRHFRREEQHGDPRFQRFDRQLQPPPHGTPMPKFPRDHRN